MQADFSLCPLAEFTSLCFGWRRLGSPLVSGSKMILGSVFPSPLRSVGRAPFKIPQEWKFKWHLLSLISSESVFRQSGPTVTSCSLSTQHSSGMCLHRQRCNPWLMFAHWRTEGGNRCKRVRLAEASAGHGVFTCGPSLQRYNSGLAIFSQGSVLCKQSLRPRGGLAPALVSVSINGACRQRRLSKVMKVLRLSG